MGKIIGLLLIPLALSGCSFLFPTERDKYQCEYYAKHSCKLYPHTKKLIEATALDLVSCNRCVESEYKRCIKMSPKEYYSTEFHHK